MIHPYLLHLNWHVEVRNGLQHLWIERQDGKPIRCGWNRLQTIVHEILGWDMTCVEFFPAVHLVVDERNRRHFWVYPNQNLPMRPTRR